MSHNIQPEYVFTIFYIGYNTYVNFRHTIMLIPTSSNNGRTSQKWGKNKRIFKITENKSDGR